MTAKEYTTPDRLIWVDIETRFFRDSQRLEARRYFGEQGQ